MDYKDIKKFVLENWKPNKQQITYIMLSIGIFLFITPITVWITGLKPENPFLVILPIIIFTLSVAFYCKKSKKTNKEAFSYSLWFAIIWNIFLTISFPSIENIVNKYIPFFGNVIRHLYFFSGMYLIIKNKKYKLGTYGFLLFSLSWFIIAVLKVVIPAQSLEFSFTSTFDITDIAVVIIQGFIFGVPLLVHADWMKKNLIKNLSVGLYSIGIGIMFFLLGLIQAVLSLAISYKNELVFFLTLYTQQVTWFGGVILLQFILTGFLAYLLLERKSIW